MPLSDSSKTCMRAVRLLPSPAGLSRMLRFRHLRGLPVLVHGVSRRAWGLRLRRAGPAARDIAAGRVAFRSGDGVGALIANFRSSIPSPSVPLFTLHWTPHGIQCKTRGRADRYSFLVRLFHPQLHAGLSRRTTTFLLTSLKNSSAAALVKRALARWTTASLATDGGL